jgi:hypothetical protein
MLFKSLEAVESYMGGNYQRSYPHGKPRATYVQRRHRQFPNERKQFCIAYYGFAVVRYTEQGISFFAGANRTNTTKKRINDACPPGVKVYQKAGRWYLQIQDVTVPFEDGISVTWDGKQAWK